MINEKIKSRKFSGPIEAAGFTLIEIIVVLSVISMGLVGILSLIIRNIDSQSYNKDNLIAYQLSQEGIELIRHVRDSNWRTGDNFNDGLAAGHYYMDYLDDLPHATSSVVGAVLYRDSNGLYVHGATVGSTATAFSRGILIDEIDENSFRVLSRVSWNSRDRDYNYDLETVLYDWR
ncbi:MAG: type II secretion system protein [Patescibacteria group bacterium]|jgi:prepilin-type N-terminal cleavage/methylation domain-containing protein